MYIINTLPEKHAKCLRPERIVLRARDWRARLLVPGERDESWGAKFIQTEDITRVLQFLFAPWFPVWMGGISKKSLASFNEVHGNQKEKAEGSGRKRISWGFRVEGFALREAYEKECSYTRVL